MGLGGHNHDRLLALVSVLALALTACWTSYGLDHDNTRSALMESAISANTVASLEEVWRIDGIEGSTSTPAVFGDSVYFGAWDGSLRAVSTKDGSPRWTTQLSGSVIDDSPLVAGDRVYIGDGAGNLHAVDRATGGVVWSRELDPHPLTRTFSSPVAVDDVIIIGVASVELAVPLPDYTFRGSIVALDAATGDEVWRIYTTTNDAEAGAGVSVWSTAAIDTGRGLAFIGTGNTYEEPAAPLGDSLMAIDYHAGTIRWTRQFTEGDVYTIFGDPPQGPDADIGAAPNLFSIGDRDVVGVGDKAGVYAALDRDTGETIWARQLWPGSHLGGVMTTAAYHDGTIYVGTNLWSNLGNFHDPDNLSLTYALDTSDGSVRWVRLMPAPAFGAFTYANGIVFQPTITGALYALDATDGSILWSDELGADLGSGVSVANGTVFAPYGFWFFAAPANPDGGVVAYRPAT
ncbi:MAG TPA: PQQ-binding-like beta-propeller repeat protein [Acidimicrobiia bacterium]|nr:PQQ-binding-like beta-propeller repeat protein [Acidimicrobiia bacterium]